MPDKVGNIAGVVHDGEGGMLQVVEASLSLEGKVIEALGGRSGEVSMICARTRLTQ